MCNIVSIVVKCTICFSTNIKISRFVYLFVCLMSIIKGMNITCNVLLKYFPDSDWLKENT